MSAWLNKLKGEKIFVVQGAVSLFLLIITVLVCSLSKGLPEENGIISAAICISVTIFIAIASTSLKEGAEGIAFAFIGSLISGIVASMVGSRITFDPSFPFRSYLISSLILAIALSLSCNLYMMPEKPDIHKDGLRGVLSWICVTAIAILINFIIIYWLPKII
ncbi:MAG: hypothetical protein QXK89_08165 [Candidatus Bathyarchaeia archaeon]|nr:hypothetical protein [Candidatus Bathyarchaeota archaeon]